MFEDLILKTVQTSKNMGSLGSGKKRDLDFVFKKLVEESGELSSEILLFLEDKDSGDDGVIGESIDCIITAIDMLNLLRVEQGFDDPEFISKTIDGSKITYDSIVGDVGKVLKYVNTCGFSKYFSIVESTLSLKSSALLSELSVAFQIYDKQTYKKAEELGFENVYDMFSTNLILYIENKFLLISTHRETILRPTELIDSSIESWWIKKLDKWVEKSKAN